MVNCGLWSEMQTNEASENFANSSTPFDRSPIFEMGIEKGRTRNILDGRVLYDESDSTSISVTQWDQGTAFV